MVWATDRLQMLHFLATREQGLWCPASHASFALEQGVLRSNHGTASIRDATSTIAVALSPPCTGSSLIASTQYVHPTQSPP